MRGKLEGFEAVKRGVGGGDGCLDRLCKMVGKGVSS